MDVPFFLLLRLNSAGQLSRTMTFPFIDLRSQDVSTWSATLLALALFFLYITGYALLVFVQFSPWQIFSVALAFTTLLVALAGLFLRPTLLRISLGPLRLNSKTVLTGLFISFLLVMSASTAGTKFLSTYIRTFPLLETELGLGWHQDTVFHVSLIQSILNFGYPSIAQHGHPLTTYHVLSHYTDALILFVTKLDPYDSYGLLFHYKIFLFLASALLAITAVTRKHGGLTYVISFVLLMPCVIGTWHAIASHGLWMASVIMLLSAPFVFQALFQQEDLGLRQLTALFWIIVAIALAKVSSGFMFAVLIGAFILGKQPRSAATYIFGLILLIFFYFYATLFFVKVENGESRMDLSLLGLLDFFNYLVHQGRFESHKIVVSLVPAVLTSTVILGILAIGKKNHVAKIGLFASLLSILCLYVITASNKNYSISDIWYFQYGLSSSVILLVFASVIHCKSSFFEFNFYKNSKPLVRFLISTIFIVFIAFLSKSTPLVDFNFFKAGPGTLKKIFIYANTRPFDILNKKIPPKKPLVTLSTRKTKIEAINELATSRSLRDLKIDIDSIIKERRLKKSETGLLLTREFFDNVMPPFGGPYWARGLLIYATTGVQLVRGVTGIPRGYGFRGNYKNYLALHEKNITSQSICELEGIKAVLVYSNPAHMNFGNKPILFDRFLKYCP